MARREAVGRQTTNFLTIAYRERLSPLQTFRFIGYLSSMLAGLIVLFGIACIGMLLTAGAFAFLHRMVASDKYVIALSGVCFPICIFVIGGIDVVCFQDVDGPPPGMVLLGSLLASAALMPFTLALGFLLGRRTRAKGH